MESSNSLVACLTSVGKFMCSSYGISFGILLLKCNSIQRGCLALVNSKCSVTVSNGDVWYLVTGTSTVTQNSWMGWSDITD